MYVSGNEVVWEDSREEVLCPGGNQFGFHGRGIHHEVACPGGNQFGFYGRGIHHETNLRFKAGDGEVPSLAKGPICSLYRSWKIVRSRTTKGGIKALRSKGITDNYILQLRIL